MTTRIVELRRGILKKNDELAAGLRERYTAAGVLVLNLVSSPGTGKTAFLELTLKEFKSRGARVAALVGDLETDNDRAPPCRKRLHRSARSIPWNLPPGCGDDRASTSKSGRA